MEGLAMLRQLIGEVQGLLEVYGSPPHYLHLHPQTQLLQPPPLQLHHQHRWCYFNTEDESTENGYHGAIMRAAKPDTSKMLDPCKPPLPKKSRRERNRGRLPVLENMETEIWKEFPEELFEAVLARLPIAMFFRFRSVCRKWNSLLTSHSFSQECARVPQAQPWFYSVTYENVSTGAMYDPSLKKWHHPAIPAFLTNLMVLPVASAGGLVCFFDTFDRRIFVGNPLTRSFKELSVRTGNLWSRAAVGMILNGESTSGGYKILRVDCDGEYEIYDSLKNSWTCPGKMPATVMLPLSLNFRSQAVAIGSTLNFMHSDPDGIVSYDMVTGVWKQFVVPSPLHVRDHTLAEYGGRIMLVGLLTKNAATCVCIWELQKMTLLWREVDRMPNLWCLDFYGKPVRMTCLGNKGLLLFSLRSRQMNRLVSYNIVNGEWLKVPGCTLPRGRKRQWLACGTAFYPCLTASA